MTKQELLQELQRYPDNATVLFHDGKHLEPLRIEFAVNEGDDVEAENATDILFGSQYPD